MMDQSLLQVITDKPTYSMAVAAPCLHAYPHFGLLYSWEFPTRKDYNSAY